MDHQQQTTHVRVPKVIGRNTGQVLVVADVTVRPPVFLVLGTDKRIFIDQCRVIENRVVVRGTLRKNITYKTRESEQRVGEVRQVSGDVKHTTLFVPFTVLVDVPGAREGDECVVENTFVEAELDELLDEVDGVFRRIREEVVVAVDVKVVRPVQIWVEGRVNG